MRYFDDMEINMYQAEEEALINFKRKAYAEVKPKRPIFTRGYDECRERLEKNSYYSRSCFNCNSYYQAVGDKEECCQNTNVIEFDMVVSNNNIYCVHWEPTKRRKNNLFKKKTGRSILD